MAKRWAIPTPVVALRMKETNAVPETSFTVQADATVNFSDNQRKTSSWLFGRFSNMWISAIRLEIVAAGNR